LRSYGEGPPSPQDVVQQAFLKLAQCEQPSQIRNMRAFLYKTSINIIIDHHRGEKRREKLLRHYSANGTYEKCDQIDPNAS
jgi:RNA polymerase sigma-70 factor (ECF subfamily)